MGLVLLEMYEREFGIVRKIAEMWERERERERVKGQMGYKKRGKHTVQTTPVVDRL
jgi:hypothetical protein